jgi:two-component system, NtrC family, sensor kinase
MERIFPMRPSRATVVGRAVLEAAVVHLPDVQRDTEFNQPLAAAFRGRSALGVPLLRDGQPIGAIVVGRSESHPFSDKQIALLQTFANQAVIAIENVRLFNETKDALERQTATSEILRVSSLPTDVQPVFDTIVRSAVGLCDAVQSNLQQFDGELLHLVATHNWPREGLEWVRTLYPMRPNHGRGAGRAVQSRAVVHIPDILEDPEYNPASVGSRSASDTPRRPRLLEAALTVVHTVVSPVEERLEGLSRVSGVSTTRVRS